MAKHLVDIEEKALSAAQAELGTKTIKETVNRALRQAARDRHRRIARAIDILVRAQLAKREDAWR